MRSGLAAEFTGAGDLMSAVKHLRQNGYRDFDAFTPHPVGGLEEELGLGRSRLNWLVFPLGIAWPTLPVVSTNVVVLLSLIWLTRYQYPEVF